MSVSINTLVVYHFYYLAETNSGTVGWEPSALPVRPIRTPHLNGVNGVFIPQLGKWLEIAFRPMRIKVVLIQPRKSPISVPIMSL